MKPLSKTLLLSLAFYFVAAISYSQVITFKKPDYELIRKAIADTSSDFYYPELMNRFKSNDTSLTDEACMYLYLGYTFQKDYKPNWDNPYEKKLLKYYQSESIKKEDYDDIIELAGKSISESPFDLRQLNYLGYVYHLKGEEEKAQATSWRFQKIVSGIMLSGDGKSCETAMHVIDVGHEYVFLNMLQFQFKGQSYGNGCDKLNVVKDSREIESLSFNVSRMMEVERKSFEH
jgi:hypothetical protein